jgi:hypothetical protein
MLCEHGSVRIGPSSGGANLRTLLYVDILLSLLIDSCMAWDDQTTGGR